MLEEISDHLDIPFSVFLQENYVDEKKLILKGNKKVTLYNKSPLFKSEIEHFLQSVFI